MTPILADDAAGHRQCPGAQIVESVQPLAGRTVDVDEVRAFVKERLGAVKTPKVVLAWDDLPRSKVGKVLKTDIKARLAAG